MDEGVAQLFTLDLNGRKVIGTVGALQFEVIQYQFTARIWELAVVLYPETFLKHVG